MSEMQDILDLEQGIENAKDLIKRRKMALELSENRTFKQVFLDDYFVKEAARLVQLSGDPALNESQRADALAMAQATGHTKRFLSMMIQMGAVAERELPEMEAELDAMRAAVQEG